MENKDFSLSFIVDKTPGEVFDAVNNVRGWWSEDLEGHTQDLNDEFTYRHGDLHFSRHKLVEIIPYEKIVWLTLDSRLPFFEKQNEWNGTKVIFEISKLDENTRLTITHLGLGPDFQCYAECSKGWTYYLENSLLPLIVTGKGNPDQKKNIQ